MDPYPGIGTRPGKPRSAGDAAALERFDARMRLPLIVAAVLPLIVVPEAGDWVGVAVSIITWIVFLVDFVVHTRYVEQFVHTSFGRFDLMVVVLTAPWFLIPGSHGGSFVVVLRLARLARLVLASPGARRLFQRLGRTAAVALGIVVVASLVAYYAEHSTNREFATVGDAIWWGVVTLTTVGYGDIVPTTSAGRWAGVAIMITGISVLGVLAGSLASFFRLDPARADTAAPQPRTQDDHAQPGGSLPADRPLHALVNEVAALREQVELLTALVTDRIHRPAEEIPRFEGKEPH